MRILLVNQSFYPDLAATGQYLTDLAIELEERKVEVTVLASRRAYLDHSVVYPKEEIMGSVAIWRVWVPEFHRFRKITRILEALSTNISFVWRYWRLPRFDRVIVLTTPPLLLWFIRIATLLKPVKISLWAMDINPEQAIETGWISKESIIARLLMYCNCFFLKGISRIAVLDSFMKDRLTRAGASPSAVKVFPLWADKQVLYPTPGSESEFRDRNGLTGKFVVMYSGNHSICHPLNTLFEAAYELRNHPTIVFVFIGGGARVSEVSRFVEQHQLSNIIQLPYQERSRLRDSLSSGDLQVVTMGERYVGLVHPSKIYGILAVGSPVLYIGPEQSPISDVVKGRNIGIQINHGDVSGAVAVIEKYYSDWSKREFSKTTQVDLGEYEKGVGVSRLAQFFIED